MKNRCKSADDLPFPGMIIVARSAFQKGGKYYPQVCLHEFFFVFFSRKFNLKHCLISIRFC